MKQYDVLIARADRTTLDLLIAAAAALPVTGVLDADSSIALYFDEGTFDDDHLETLRAFLPADVRVDFERSQVEEQNWNAEFEASLEPVKLANGLVITQSWNPVEAEAGELVVVIDPKMSFGTGHHESTRLISELMMKLDLTGKNVLDVGTGTGVLAIIAARRGAARIVAFDNNEWAVENTRENLELNDVAGQVDLHQAELEELEDTGFDVVVANLHRNLIIRLLPQFVDRFGGDSPILLTSGVLIEDYDSLLDAAAEHGLYPIDERRENEWVATAFSTRVP